MKKSGKPPSGRNCVHLLVATCTALACAGAVAQTSLSFRGSQLGDTVPQVRAAALREFTDVVADEAPAIGAPVIYAGDASSVSDRLCAYAAPDTLRRACVFVRYVFGDVKLGAPLNLITVEQAFVPGVSLQSFRQRLAGTYGAARVTYRTPDPDVPMGQPRGEIHTMVWGGDKTPPRTYRVNAFPYEDMQAIGGRFIVIAIQADGDRVRGYRLRIVDSAGMRRSDEQYLKDSRARDEQRKRDAEAAVKF